MHSYYLERGHSLKSLLELDPIEKMFYMASMEAALDERGGE